MHADGCPLTQNTERHQDADVVAALRGGGGGGERGGAPQPGCWGRRQGRSETEERRGREGWEMESLLMRTMTMLVMAAPEGGREGRAGQGREEVERAEPGNSPPPPPPQVREGWKVVGPGIWQREAWRHGAPKDRQSCCWSTAHAQVAHPTAYSNPAPAAPSSPGSGPARTGSSSCRPAPPTVQRPPPPRLPPPPLTHSAAQETVTASIPSWPLLADRHRARPPRRPHPASQRLSSLRPSCTAANYDRTFSGRQAPRFLRRCIARLHFILTTIAAVP